MSQSDRDAAVKQLAEHIQRRMMQVARSGLIEVGSWRDPDVYARALVAELDSDDDSLAAEAALTISEWEPWIDHGGFDIPARWWATPLGRLTLLASSQTSGEMSVPDAMSALRVSRARIYQLLGDGRLKRGRAGGITRRSVARQLEPRA